MGAKDIWDDIYIPAPGQRYFSKEQFVRSRIDGSISSIRTLDRRIREDGLPFNRMDKTIDIEEFHKWKKRREKYGSNS